MKPWSDLTAAEQLDLRLAYGRDPEGQATTCSLAAKTAHFAAWLARRGIAFSATDLPARPPRRPLL